MRRLRALLLAATLAAGLGLAPAGAHAQPAASASRLPPQLPAEQAEALLRSDRFRALAAELRCLVCQNQTLADSNADLAIDLRNEVLRQMATGKDDGAIKEHLVARYGEFVLYRPALSARNAALWAGPAVLLAIGAIVVLRLARRRPAPAASSAPVDEARLRRIERLLDDDASTGPR